jgi:hypothetical protein
MKLSMHAFKVFAIQWIVGIKNDPVGSYFTCFKLYTLNYSLTYTKPPVYD